MCCAVSLPRALEQGDSAAAESSFQEALAVDPTHKVVNLKLSLGLCTAQKQLKKLTDAISSCQKALEFEPGNTAANKLLVQLMIDEEQFQEAVNKAKELLNSDQNNAEYHEVGVGGV
jgi:DnaJ family protein C protein 7